VKLRLLLAFALATAMYAGPVTAVCDSVWSLDSCSTGHSSAGGRVTLTLAADPSQWSTLTTYQGVSDDDYDSRPPVETTHSSAVTIDWSQLLTTAGPARDGFLQVQASAEGGNPYNGEIRMNMGFDISQDALSQAYGGFHGTWLSCNARFASDCDASNWYSHLGYPSITLGTTMNLMAQGGAINSAGLNEGMSRGDLTTTFQFRFVEGDGVTPVRVEFISDAPEPATYGLIGLSLASAALLRNRRRR
jgi:PEP-CTERM motif